jgi:RHS repeat-associated protein
VIDSAGTQHALLRYRWTGREFDAETGRYYFRSRYYSSAQHRFVQEDPIGYAGGGNLYAYVDGHLLEATDPDGTMYRDVNGGGGGGGARAPRNDMGALGRNTDWWAGFLDGPDFLIFNVYVNGEYAGSAYDDGHFGLQYSLEPNLNTGDRNMDNPKYREWIDDNLANAPEDGRHPGYTSEVGGWCTKSGCTREVGSATAVDIGKAPKGVLFAYHGHLNVGKPAFDLGSGFFEAWPSDGDLMQYNGTNPREAPTYIFSNPTSYRGLDKGRIYSLVPTSTGLVWHEYNRYR